MDKNLASEHRKQLLASEHTKQFVEILNLYYFLQYLKNNNKEIVIEQINLDFKQLNTNIIKYLEDCINGSYVDIRLMDGTDGLDAIKYNVFLNERNK